MMKSVLKTLVIFVISQLGSGAFAGDMSSAPPAWAYPLNTGGASKPRPDDGVLHTVPDSPVSLPLSAITNRFNAVDWHPDGHPSMPESVAHGRKPDVYACGFCHLPNGQGRSENAALAGLPATYIIEQVEAMARGDRRSSQPAMLAPALMWPIASHATPEEVASAAAYFAALPYKPWIRVVEGELAPKTEIAGVSALAPVTPTVMEPIGDRIVEVPENPELTALRDDASGFVAYVPVGSLAKGDEIAHTTLENRISCVTCHGADMKGTALAPPIAGRSPSYLFRQLFDIRQGARKGSTVAAMQTEVSGMTDADMRAVVAYVASLKP